MSRREGEPDELTMLAEIAEANRKADTAGNISTLVFVMEKRGAWGDKYITLRVYSPERSGAGAGSEDVAAAIRMLWRVVVRRMSSSDAYEPAPPDSPPATSDRGTPACEHCGKPATCLGAYEGAELAYACDECCGHACEDGSCWSLDHLEKVADVLLPEELDAICDRDGAAAKARPITILRLEEAGLVLSMESENEGGLAFHTTWTLQGRALKKWRTR